MGVSALADSLVFFGTSRCPFCKEIEPHLDRLKKQYPDLHIEKIDGDQNPEELRTLRIRSYPTLLALRKGQIIARAEEMTNLERDINNLVRAKVEDPAKLSWMDVFQPARLFNKLLHRILYQPQTCSRTDFDLKFDALQKAGLPLERFLVNTVDGHELELWFAANAKSKGATKLYFHGNASDINSFSKEAQKAYDEGKSICMFSYRGYSGNAGHPSRQGLVHDADAVLEFLLSYKNIDSKNIEIEAHSLGTAVALATLASRVRTHPELQYGKVTLYAPFTSLKDMVFEKLWFMPKLLLNRWVDDSSWNSLEAIEAVKDHVQELSIIHGKRDLLIPVKHGQLLHTYASSKGIKSGFTTKHAGHDDIVDLAK